MVREELKGLIYEVINDARPGTIEPGQTRNISCVIHGSDVKPSARVFPDTETYICYACGTYCDVIGLIMKLEEVEFLDAIKIIADRYGIILKGGAKKKKEEDLGPLVRFCEDAVIETRHERFNKIYFEIDRAHQNKDAQRLVKIANMLLERLKDGQASS